MDIETRLSILADAAKYDASCASSGAAGRRAHRGGMPNLDPELDPKLGWALEHREHFPVDLNRADKPQPLRVPGIGVRNVARILRMRRWHRLRTRDLVQLRVALGRALPFVVVADHSPGPLTDALDLRRRVAAKEQLDLFRVVESARSGEL